MGFRRNTGDLACSGSKKLRPFFYQLLTKSRVQFILYDVDDFKTLASLIDQSIIQTKVIEVLYVLGRYSADQESTPDQLDPFLDIRERFKKTFTPTREMICAFGREPDPVPTPCGFGRYRSPHRFRKWHMVARWNSCRNQCCAR